MRIIRRSALMVPYRFYIMTWYIGPFDTQRVGCFLQLVIKYIRNSPTLKMAPTVAILKLFAIAIAKSC